MTRDSAFPRLVVIGAICLLLAGIARAQEPPVVRETNPPDGTVEVDWHTDEITVTFDQEMGRGFSWEGVGPDFPDRSGKIRWVDDYTCAMPVDLEPGRTYVLWINSEEHTEFRSKQGFSAAPVRWTFSTRDDSKAPEVIAEKQRIDRINSSSWSELERVIGHYYAHYDLRRPDWTGKFMEYRPKALQARDAREWVRIAAEMLSCTGDLQLHFEDGKRETFIKTEEVGLLANESAVSRYMRNMWATNDTITFGRTGEGIGYLWVASIEEEKSSDFDALETVLENMAECKVFIVDVRCVTDGSSEIAARVAGWLTDQRIVYAIEETRSVFEKNGFSKPKERWLEPAGEGKFIDKPIYVLSGPGLRKNGEAFMLMLKACPNVTVIGPPTRGSMGQMGQLELPNGVTIHYPTTRVSEPDGTGIEGQGVMPDVFLKPDAYAYYYGDPVFMRAFRMAQDELSDWKPPPIH